MHQKHQLINKTLTIIFLVLYLAQAQANSLIPVTAYLLDNETPGTINEFDSTVIPIPSLGAYLGVFTAEDTPSGDSQYSIAGRLFGIAEHEKLIYQTTFNTKRIAFDRQFYRWDNFIRNNDIHPYLYETSALGRTPIVSITSKLSDGSPLTCPDNSDKLAWSCITSGEFDDHIINIAQKIKNSGLSQISFTFVHEPEDEIRCNPNDQCMGTAAEYVSAWRHLVTLFRQQNVTNVDFMWIVRDNIFGDSVPAGFPTANEIYPGDDYIDWIAADTYNYSFFSNDAYQWRALSEVAGDFYAWASQRPKPLAFGEWGSREEYFNPTNDGTRKAQWFNDAQTWLKNDAIKIKAIMYFNRYPEDEFNNPDAFGNTGPNWKIDTTPASLNAYQRLAQDPYFIGVDVNQ